MFVRTSFKLTAHIKEEMTFISFKELVRVKDTFRGSQDEVGGAEGVCVQEAISVTTGRDVYDSGREFIRII